MGLFTNYAKKRALQQADKAEKDLQGALSRRQEIINPYAGVTDLSNLITNPFANLQVATEAAEMQAEESDISLASTLDLLRATGAGAAGATALAQEATRGKRGIAASIEKQEAENARLRAKGEAQVMGMRMAEQERLQSADILGKTFMFESQEMRDIADISRSSAILQGARQQYQDAKASSKALWGGIIGGAFSGLTAAAGAGAFNPKPKPSGSKRTR